MSILQINCLDEERSSFSVQCIPRIYHNAIPRPGCGKDIDQMKGYIAKTGSPQDDTCSLKSVI